MEKDCKYCGECCWFCFEMTDGDGQCVEVGDDGYPMMMTRCDSKACGKFVSRELMRHYMAVLVKKIRWEDDADFIHYAPDGDEAVAAMKFAYKFMKILGKL